MSNPLLINQLSKLLSKRSLTPTATAAAEIGSLIRDALAHLEEAAVEPRFERVPHDSHLYEMPSKVERQQSIRAAGTALNNAAEAHKKLGASLTEGRVLMKVFSDLLDG